MGREEKRGKGQKDYKNRQKTMNKLVVSPFLSVIASNVSGLSSQSKESGWVDFQRPTHFGFEDTHAESEGMERDVTCKWWRKRARMAIRIYLLSQEVSQKTKKDTI